MKYLLGVTLLFCASCGAIPTTADLRFLADELDDVTKTSDEKADAIRARVDEIEARPSEIPTDPLSLAIYLAGLGATAIGTTAEVNRRRNKARKIRGEQV